MIHAFLALVVLLAAQKSPSAPDAPPQASDELRSRFLALHEKGDHEACAKMWRENPSLALPTIERDLDLALALRAPKQGESSTAPDLAAVRALEDRATWGARIAREALAAPLIADLACARVGWSEGDRRLFREQRAVHGRAIAWLEKGENRSALEAARESVTRSLALGDWHGAAQSYETCALAHQALSSFDDALVAWSQARVLYRELALTDQESACLRAVLDMCFAAERPSRGREAAEQAIAAARARRDRPWEAELLERRAGFEEKLGLSTEAEATRREAQALKGPKSQTGPTK